MAHYLSVNAKLASRGVHQDRHVGQDGVLAYTWSSQTKISEKNPRKNPEKMLEKALENPRKF